MQTHSLMEAAGLLGVNKTTLQTWLSQGCPAVERADRATGRAWKICLADVMEWRIDRAVADAVAAHGGDGSGMSKDEADRRRAVALSHMAEIDLDDRLGRTVDRVEMVTTFADFCQSLRHGMDSGFNKIAARGSTITNPPEIARMCREEWVRAMRNARAEFGRLCDERFGTKGARPLPDAE